MAAGSIIIDLLMRTGAFETDTKRAEKRLKDFQKQAEATGKAVGKALVGIGAAAVAALYGVDRLVKGAGEFQDLAEMTGAAADEIASYSVAAAVAGVEIGSVAEAMNKLTKNLVGVDDESKAAGAALATIGISIKEFKRLDPAAQYEAVGRALAGFEDGAGKTAVALALFGKSGAEQLKVFKALEEAGGRQSILTAEQIRLADEYADTQARARAELGQYAQVIAIQAAPAFTALTKAGSEVIKELLGMEKAAGDLSVSRSILNFAEGAALALGTVIESAVAVGKAVRAIAGSFEAVWADVKLGAQNATPAMLAKNFATGELAKQFEERNKVVDGANERYRDLWNYNGTAVTDAIRSSFAAQRNAMDQGLSTGDFSRLDRKRPKRTLNYDGPDKANSAQALLKKELDGQLKAIREFADQQRDAYQFANEYARGAYEEGLQSLQSYFDQQRALREAGLQVQLNAFDKEIEALKAYQAKALKPEDRADAENKIADAVAKRGGAVQKAGQDAILAHQRERQELDALKQRYEDFRATLLDLGGDYAGAAQIRIGRQVENARKLLQQSGGSGAEADQLAKLLTLQSQRSEAQREYGLLVDKARTSEEAALLAAELAGTSEIDTLRQIGAIRNSALADMQALADQAERIAQALGTPEARLWADQLALGLAKARAEADPLFLKMRDIGKEIGSAIADPIGDAIVEFKSMRDLLGEIEKNLIRIGTRELFTKPFESYLGNLFGGNGTAGGGVPPNPFAQGGGGGGLLGGFLSFLGFGGSYASGGTLGAGKWGIAGEAGPEIIHGPARITPMNRDTGALDRMAQRSGGGQSVVQNFNFAAPTDSRTRAQVGKEAARGLREAQRIS